MPIEPWMSESEKRTEVEKEAKLKEEEVKGQFRRMPLSGSFTLGQELLIPEVQMRNAPAFSVLNGEAVFPARKMSEKEAKNILLIKAMDEIRHLLQDANNSSFNLSLSFEWGSMYKEIAPHEVKAVVLIVHYEEKEFDKPNSFEKPRRGFSISRGNNE